jgi:hypothetical protein
VLRGITLCICTVQTVVRVLSAVLSCLTIVFISIVLLLNIEKMVAGILDKSNYFTKGNFRAKPGSGALVWLMERDNPGYVLSNFKCRFQPLSRLMAKRGWNVSRGADPCF